MGDLDPFSIPKISDLFHVRPSPEDGLPKKDYDNNKKNKDLPMKTKNAKNLAVGILVMIGAFTAAPVSQADTGAVPAGYKRINVAFAFDRQAPAEKVYGDLYRIARNACTDKSVSPLALRRISQKCIAEMVDSGVAQFGRADIAELHKGRITVANR